MGLAISLVLHMGLLGWATWSLLTTRELKGPEPVAISVAILTPSDVLRLKKGSETSKQLEAKAKDNEAPQISKKEAPKPKPVESQKPPDPIAEKLAKLPPTPTPEEIKKKQEEKKQAEEAKRKAEAEKKKKAEDAKRKAEAAKKKKAEAERRKREKARKLAEKKKREAEKKKTSAADRLAALLDKDPTKRGAPQSATPPQTDTDYTGPTAGTDRGTDTVLSAREQDLLRGMLKSQIAPCWRLPGGGGGTETPIVELRWRLNRDGSLQGEPQITRRGSGPYGGLANEAAIRAVKSCQPFQLPADKYQSWKDVIWEFDPSQML
jgi:colicin import membrane protein